MSENKELDTILIVAAALMAAVTLVLTFFGFSPLGGMKLFRFIIGMFALVTAIIYTASLARGNKWSWGGLTCWAVIATINFSQAVWLAH